MADNPTPYAARLSDALLDNAAIRNNLSDEQAKPLYDWGLTLAQSIGAGLESLQPDEETFMETYYGGLMKLLTRINWAATYRQEKGADWTTRTLNQLNDLNQQIRGEDAPQIPEPQLALYASSADGLSVEAFMQALMGHLSPPPENPLDNPTGATA